jgi:hypothetical protein
MRKHLPHGSRLALVFVSAVVLVAQQMEHTNAFTGTWKLNVAKSKISPGPLPQSITITFAPDGTTTLEIVNDKGKTYHRSFPWSGGKEVPFTGEGVENTVMISSIQGRTKDNILKTNGKVVLTSRDVVSPDGRTLTMTFDTTDEQGRSVHGVEVYEKQ